MSPFLLIFWMTMFSYSLCSGPAAGGGEAKSESISGSSMDTEKTKLLRVGYFLPLECPFISTEDNQFDIKWFKDSAPMPELSERYKIYPGNSSLVIASAVIEDVGLYGCQTEGQTSVKAFNISVVFVKYTKMPKSVTVLQGDKLALICEAEGSPSPIIAWYKDGKVISSQVNESRYVLDQNDKEIENASFLIEKAEYEDRGEYACSIITAGVTFNTTSFVRVKDMYAALWPFLGICAEVIVLCIIIFVYEKRRMKVEFEESDNDQPEVKSSTENKDVRQRK